MSSVHLEPQDLPEVAPHNHGRTVAGWATMGGLVIATLLLAIGIAFALAPFIVAGIVMVVLSLAAGAVLRALGHGQPLA